MNSGEAVSDRFPAGLRVLVVDDDPTCLMILGRMLRSCLYEVTKCNRAETALSLLRENKNGFDVVISDVHMPDMDGFKLLEHIGLEMDIPVIMISADDDKNTVMKCLTFGACDYLIKPICIETLKNIWQHVVRKRRNEWRDTEQSGTAEEGDDASTLKKPRLVWSRELHQQFVSAVDQLGIDTVSDRFPAGLRVLVVDDDPTCLMILERMLRTCLYEVTKCNRAETALSLLRENKNGFDVVISDVHMPDMNGFELLEHIGLEMDIPVIMMSADDDKNTVMKCLTYGACDYLIKPICIETLKNIWQHVVRKRRNEWRDTEQSGTAEEGDDASTLKKPRLVWSRELHQQFVSAVDQLGIDKAVPKKILALMNIPWLTIENVASHLQKYRLYLSRLSSMSQHQNNLNISFLNPREAPFGSISLVNGIDLQTLTASGQLPAQSLATLQAASNLHESTQSLGNMNLRVNASGSHNNPLLMQMAQSPYQGQMLSENTGPPPVPQSSSLMSFPMNQTTEMSVNSFPLGSTPGISTITTKGSFQEEVTSGIKGSAGFPSYDIFSELHHQKSNDWEINLGLTYDASQNSNPLQRNIDVSPSVLVHRGFSSAQQTGQNRDATAIGKTMFPWEKAWNKVIFTMRVNTSTPRSRLIQFSFFMLLVFCFLFFWSKPLLGQY